MNTNAAECPVATGRHSALSAEGTSVLIGSLSYIEQLIEGIATVLSLSDPDSKTLDDFALGTLQAMARDSAERAVEEIQSVRTLLQKQAAREVH